MFALLLTRSGPVSGTGDNGMSPEATAQPWSALPSADQRLESSLADQRPAFYSRLCAPHSRRPQLRAAAVLLGYDRKAWNEDGGFDEEAP